jgi:putative copper resistance protein D
VTSLAFHVVGAALWVGGLAGLLLLRRSDVLAKAAAGYSRLALWCFVAVGLSGAANAWVRLGAVDALWTSRYGLLVVGKLIALVVLGGFGAAHRGRTLTRLQAGAAGAFRRLAAGEVVVFAATIGLAVALSRSPTPVPSIPTNPDPTTDLVGFPMPAAPTLGRLISDVLPDPWFGTIVVVGIGLYLVGVLRLRKRGIQWPVHRLVCWIAGLLVLAAVTMLGVGRYAYLLFSAHMFQHMMLSMVVPVLLVLGAPATLALRAIRPSGDPNVRGPREWLLQILHSRAMRVLAHPVVATGLFVASLYGLYFSGLFEAAMRSHLGHLWMLTHFILVGYLFFWVVIGVDPGPRKLPYPIRIPIHFAGMAMHAFFGVALLQAGTVLAAGWYVGLHRPWLTDLLSDQNLAAGITWAFGEFPSVVVLGALFWQWIRADEREQRRVDRAAQRAERAALASGTEPDGELARYNAALRRLHEADQRR